MGAQFAGKKSGGRYRRSGYRAQSDINVTPFVDVMLVLLVVFMVAAPLMSVGVAVDLPKTQASMLPTEKDPLIVSVKPDGAIFVMETPVELTSLVPMLAAISGGNPDTRIMVRGDQRLTYGRVMQVMGAMSAAGFKKVALVAELPAPSASAPSSSPVTSSPAKPALKSR
ncbi:biopolymer transport protein TolR [Azospirillaceae bacterium]